LRKNIKTQVVKVHVKKILALFLCMLSFSPLMSQDIVWGTPAAVSSSGVDATTPQIVMDANANAIAAWVEGGLVKSSTFNGTSWSALTTLSGSSAASPRLGIDSSGNVTAIWLSSTGVVTVATLPSGGSWSAASSLSSASASTPSLAVQTNGDAAVTWVRGGLIEATTRVSGTWSLVVQTFALNPSSDNPSVAVGDNGTAVIVWHQVVSGTDQISSSSSSLGGSWGAVKTIQVLQGAHSQNYPKIAVDSNGNAAVIWYRFDVSGTDFVNVNVLSSTLTAGAGNWALPSILSDVTALSFRDPSKFRSKILFDSSGNAIALWGSSSDGTRFDVQSAVQLKGGIWRSATTVIGGNLYAYSADVSVNSYGDALGVFMFFDGSNMLIQSAQSDYTGPFTTSWSPAITLSTGTENATPRVASIYSSGVVNAAAIWINGDSGNNLIYTSIGTKTVLLPPTGVTASQSSINRGVYTDYVNSLTWTASADPNAVGYAIYRNGIFFINVDGSTLSYDDHNAIQNGTVVYGVASIGSESDQSPMATYTIFP
jgi:hypothetical protein